MRQSHPNLSTDTVKDKHLDNSTLTNKCVPSIKSPFHLYLAHDSISEDRPNLHSCPFYIRRRVISANGGHSNDDLYTTPWKTDLYRWRISLAGSPAFPDSSSPADMTTGLMPSFLYPSVHWKVLPWPLPPQIPKIRGTLIFGSSKKFLAT